MSKLRTTIGPYIMTKMRNFIKSISSFQVLRVMPLMFLVTLIALAGCGGGGGNGDGDNDEESGGGSDDMLTGLQVPGLESYDRIIARLIDEYDIPGAAIAVVHHGRLIYARGFGLADRENSERVQPDSLFRIASVSKPITAAAVLKLVEEGQLDLDARVFRDLLDEIKPYQVSDPKMNLITIRDLLRHSGGFDSAISGDPQFNQKAISKEIGKSTPLGCVDIIAFMKSQDLDFKPGERYAYSNFGYCVLGQVIEKISGMSYEDYVRKEILIPAGVLRMRIADPFLSGRLENEVKYYDYPGAELSESLDTRVRTRVPWPYNGFLSTMDAHGGWAGSAIDLVRFINAVDRRGNDDVIADMTSALMIAPQRIPPFEQGPVWYAFGWLVRDPGNGEANWWHAGSVSGSTSLVVRAGNGFSWAAVMNSRPENFEDFNGVLDNSLWEAFHEVTRWPEHDLFSSFQ